MADQTTNKKVVYELQGNDTGLIKTVTNALKRLDALDAKLQRVSQRKDVSPIKEGTERDAVARVNAIVKSLQDLQKIGNLLTTANIDVLTPAQIAVIKTATTTLNELAKSLGTARNAGSVTQEQLDKIAKVTKQLQQAFKAANIPVAEQKKELSDNAKAAKSAAANAKTLRNEQRAAKQASIDFNRSLNTLKTTLRSIYSIGRTLFVGAVKLMKLAGDFGETMNKFNVVAGTSKDTLGKFAQEMSNSFGLDIKDMYETTSAFKSIANSIGLADKQAEIFTKNMSQLSLDLASLYNKDVETAMNALVSGIHGQQKPLKQFETYLYDANIEYEALQLGITRSVDSMSQAEKMMLRYLSVLRQTDGAQGDLAKTLTSTSNQIKVFQAQWEMLKRSAGSVVTIFAKMVVPALNVAMAAFATFLTRIAQMLGFTIEDFSTNFSNASDSIADADDELENFEKTVKGLTSLDEINQFSFSADTNMDAFSVDPKILEAMDKLGVYDNKMQELQQHIADKAEKLANILENTLAGDIIKLTADGLKKIGEAIDYVSEHFEEFEPLIKLVTNLLVIFLGVAVVSKVTAWTKSFISFGAQLQKFTVQLPKAQKAFTGYLQTTTEGVNGLTLALGALTFAMSEAIFSSLLNSLDEKTRRIVATIGILVAALGAAAIAWMAYHGAMTWGTAIPIITAAIGVGVASMKALWPSVPQMATGGVVDSPTVAMIGEGKYDEAVVPLGRSPQFKSMKEDIAAEVARKLTPTPSSQVGQPSSVDANRPIILQLNGREVARGILPEIQLTQNQVGVKTKW